MTHAKVLWRCGSRTSPGPFYIRTGEPESWTGGTFNQGEPIIPCNPRNRRPVGGHTIGWRRDDKTSTYSASGGAYGFAGKAAVTYSNEIRLGWRNHVDQPVPSLKDADCPGVDDTKYSDVFGDFKDEVRGPKSPKG
jgi:hypothetical protein